MVNDMENFLEEFRLDRRNANIESLIRSDTPSWDIREAREAVRKWVYAGLIDCIGSREATQWLPEYEQIVDWLCYNDGKGLLLHGDCGLGKSLITTQIIPTFVHKQFKKRTTITDARELKTHFTSGGYKCLYQVIDDVGTEREVYEYGNKRDYFPELVDYATNHGLLLVVSSNLSKEELEKYGQRTFDRIRSHFKRVELRGKSLRATAR